VTNGNSLKTVRVLIADDHKLIREGLALLIGLKSGFEVIAQASDGIEAFQLAEQKRPDVAIIDLALPGLDGIEVTRRIKRVLPETAVIVITGSLGADAVNAALAGGADGYVPKDTDSTELMHALRCVAGGGSYVGQQLASAFSPEGPAEDSGKADLTSRELEIATLIAGGCSNKQVAEQLDLSIGTARKHRENIMRKLGLRNTAELTAFAIKQGWTPTI
jgi:DNA-binding NarL/FixJ family response regulator